MSLVLFTDILVEISSLCTIIALVIWNLIIKCLLPNHRQNDCANVEDCNSNVDEKNSSHFSVYFLERVVKVIRSGFMDVFHSTDNFAIHVFNFIPPPQSYFIRTQGSTRTTQEFVKFN